MKIGIITYCNPSVNVNSWSQSDHINISAFTVPVSHCLTWHKWGYSLKVLYFICIILIQIILCISGIQTSLIWPSMFVWFQSQTRRFFKSSNQCSGANPSNTLIVFGHLDSLAWLKMVLMISQLCFKCLEQFNSSNT